MLVHSDIPQIENVTTIIFTDDTVVLTSGKTNEETVRKRQQASDNIWTKTWKFKINEHKLIHVDFTLHIKTNVYVLVTFNNNIQ